MYIIFGLLVLLAVLLIVLVVLGNFLPGDWTVEKAILVQATPDEIFPFVANMQHWQEWSVWNEENGVEVKYEGQSSGQGAVQVWTGSQFDAKLIVTRSDAPKILEFRLELDGGKFNVVGTFALDTTMPGHSQVACRVGLLAQKNFNPIYRYQAYFLRNYFATAIQESLQGLQNLFGMEEINDPLEID